MKIYAIEVQSDLGRRTVQLSPPIDVEPTGAMPPQFRSLIGMFWGVICEIAAKGAELTTAAPKVEA